MGAPRAGRYKGAVVRFQATIPWLLVGGLGGCAAPPPPPPVVLAPAAPAPAAPTAAAPAPAAPGPADEAALRDALATAADPAPAALALLALLADAERHAEALAVAEAAHRRRPTAALQVAIAGLHRDLGQRHRAAALLGQLLAERGAAALHPGLLAELAELQALEGEPAAAAATLAALRREHAGDPWVAANAAELDAFAAELAAGAAPRRVRLRDLLGNLRGAPSALVRVRTLEQLVGFPGTPAAAALPVAAAELDALRRRAVAIGLGDAAAVVRARALQLGAPADDAEAAALLDAAFADPGAEVRAAAAALAVDWQRGAALPRLLAALDGETAAPVVAALDQALARLALEAPAPEPLDPAARRAYWRRRWGA